MANNIFRVQVGAQIGTSTITLKNDIQNVLNTISKDPPKVSVELNKTISKTLLQASLDDVVKQLKIDLGNIQTVGKIGIPTSSGSSGTSSGTDTTKKKVDAEKAAAKEKLRLEREFQKEWKKLLVEEAAEQKRIEEEKAAVIRRTYETRRWNLQQTFDEDARQQKAAEQKRKEAAQRAKDEAKATQASQKQTDSLLKQLNRESSKLNLWSSVGIQYKKKFDLLAESIKNGSRSTQALTKDINNLSREAKRAGAMAESAGQKFARMLGEKIRWTVVTIGLMKVRQALRQVYTNVVELDTAMTELKKVTDETDETYRKFMDSAANRAKTLGATMSDTINATANFARLGYSLSDSADLADAALVYKNVGDGIATIDEASESVIATMQAFGIAAQDAMTIVDKFNEVGNNFAISSKGVGDALLRSAASMYAANNTLDETIALAAAMNTVVQDPEKVGTTLKTVSMYLRAAKTEAEDAGESTDGMAESVSKLRDELLKLTNNKVDIQLDENTYKSTYQILKELSGVWNQLADITQANILEKLAGKRNANAVSALLENFTVAENALIDSQNAAGSALAENEKYLDSINGKMDQLRATWEQFSANILSSSFVKGLIDALRNILDAFNKLDEATNGASSTLLLLSASAGIVYSIFSAFSPQANNVLKLLMKFAPLRNMILGVKSALIVATASSTSFAGSISSVLGLLAPYAAMLGAVAAAIYGVYKAYQWYREKNPTLDDLRDQYDDAKQKADDLSASIKTNKERIAELQKLLESGSITLVEQDELDRLQKENELLDAQYQIEQALMQQRKEEIAGAARRNASDFLSDGQDVEGSYGIIIGHTNSGKQDVDQYLSEYKDAVAAIQAEYERAAQDGAAVNQSLIAEQEKIKTNALTMLKDRTEEITGLIADMDPEKDAEAIGELQKMLYAVELAIGGNNAAGSVFNKIINQDQFKGAADALRKLANSGELTASALADLAKSNDNVDSLLALLEELELTDLSTQIQQISDLSDKWNALNNGNVDYNKRKVLSGQDVLSAGYDGVNPEDIVTTLTHGFYGSDFDSTSKPMANSYIEITPILDDGSILSPNALEAYVQKLFQSDNILEADKVLNGGLGLVVNFWDHNPTDAEFDTYFDGLDEVKQAHADAFESASGDVESFINTLKDSESAISDIQNDVVNLTDQLKALTEAYDLLSSAQNELKKTGVLSAETLKKISEKTPALKASVDQYLMGLKSGKELLNDLKSSYTSDRDAYIKSVVAKAEKSTEFYKSLSSNEQEKIRTLAGAYADDLENFKTIEGKKLEYQAKVIQALSLNTMNYTSSTLEGLKNQLAGLSRGNWETMSAERKADIKALTDTIRQIESFNQGLDDIVAGNLITNIDKIITTTVGSDSTKTSTDAWKEKASQEIAALKHLREIEKITNQQYYDGLEAIENKYYKNSAANQAKYADEIRSIDEELFNGRRQLNEDWLNDQQVLAERAAASGDTVGQKQIMESMLQRVEEMIDAAHRYGLDESSDYVQELRSKLSDLQNDILDAIKDTFDEFISYMDDFDLWKGFDFSKLDVLKRKLQDVIDLYDEGQLSWDAYVSARNEIAKEMYDTQRDSLETILDLTMDMIKQEAEDQVDALDEQIDAYKKIIDLKKKMLQDTADEKDHQKAVADAVKEIAELQSKIAQLSLDDSREAAAKRAELEEQLYQKQQDLADLQNDYALDQTLDALDKTQEAFEDEKEAEKDAVEKSVDSWQKLYEKAIKRINGDWDGLYKDLMEYEREHRDSIDGPDSLVTAWKNATAAMQAYNNSFEDAYQNASSNSINPEAVNSAEARNILSKMQANSILAQQMGTRMVGGVDLHAENEKLAEEYYQLTGQKLVYNNGWRLDNSNGGLAYTVNTKPSTSVGTSGNQSGSTSGNASQGTAYNAAVAKYGNPPSGTLKIGSSGDGVKWLQYYLKQLGLFNYAVDGTFYTRTAEALKAFQKMAGLTQDGIYGSRTRAALKKYHTGGIVDGTGAINDKEVLAILQKGELVLDDVKKQNLKNMLSGIRSMITGLTSSNLSNSMASMRPALAGNTGDTFAPRINVTIQHNGEMTDADAKRYGNTIADTALDKLKNAFAKRGRS